MTSFVQASSETIKPQGKARYSFSDIVQIICVTSFSTFVISPPLLINQAARGVALLAVGLFLLIEVVKHPETFLRPTWTTVAVVVYACYINIFGYFADGMSDIIRNFDLNFFLFCVFILEIFRRRNLEYLKWPALAVCLTSVAWVVITLIAMEGQRNVARVITRTSTDSEALMSAGVGGFGLTYFACAMIPTLIYVLRATDLNPRWLKIPTWIYLILLVTLVIRAGFFIAVVLGFAAALISVFYVKGTQKAFLQATLMISLVLVGGLLTSSQIRDFAIEMSAGTMYEQKVEDTTDFLNDNTADGTFGVRAERYQRSLQIFAENPFVGVTSVQNVGKHSQILDSFARFGVLIGGLLPLIILLEGRVFSKRYYGTTAFPLVAVTLLLVLCMGLVNNISMGVGIVAFIVMPTAVHAIAQAERKSDDLGLPVPRENLTG